jgi:arylsulfatase A-like enzyme
MVFNQAYAAAANCAPSRACLMTGRYTPAHGIYTVASSERGDARTRKIVPAKNTTVLRNEFHTLAEALQEAGYTTASLGKWHLGDDPCSQGFDLNVAGSLRGHPRSYFAPYGGPELEAPAGEYLTDRLTRGGTEIHAAEQTPTILSLSALLCGSYADPAQRFAGTKIPGERGNGLPVKCSLCCHGDNMDRCIGWLLEDLERTGRRANTLVIFTSDNGGIREISCQDP